MASHKVLMYSFKGGAGRTVSMANIAYIMASEMGKRVVCIDLDIESAGASVLFGLQDEVRAGRCWTLQDVLRGYFDPPGLGPKRREGGRQTITLGTANFEQQVWQQLARRIHTAADGGYLDFLPSRTIITALGEPRAFSASSMTIFERLLQKIDLLASPPDYVLFDSASGLQDAATLGLHNCNTLVIFVRWSRQFVFGTIHFIRDYILTPTMTRRLANVLVVPTAVPVIPAGGALGEQVAKRKEDLVHTVRSVNVDAVKKFEAQRANWISVLDPIYECAGLKWDDRVFLMENSQPPDQETTTVLNAYRSLAVSIVKSRDGGDGRTPARD